MKKLVCLAALVIVTSHLFSQELQPIEFKPVKNDYLAKSKWQRTTGWILTGTGVAVTSIVLMLELADLAEEVTLTVVSVMMLSGETPEAHSKDRSALLVTGTAMMVTGLTFLSIAKKNKRKALSMSFINEPSQQLRFNTVMNTAVPSVHVSWQF